jgi:cyclic-di-AMP phosphodiesterase PgpH
MNVQAMRQFKNWLFCLKPTNLERGKWCVLIFTSFVCALLLSTVISELLTPSKYNLGDVAEYTIRAPREIVIENQKNDSSKKSYSVMRRGEVIVRAGDVVTESQELKLHQLNRDVEAKNFIPSFFGYFLISATILLSVYSFTKFFWQDKSVQTKDLWIASFVLIGNLLLLKAVSFLSITLGESYSYFDSDTYLYFTPFAAGGILLQVTAGAPAVFLFMLSFSLLTGLLLKNSWIVLLLIITGNIVGSLAVRKCSRRSAFISAGARVAFVNVFIVSCFLLIFKEHSLAGNINCLFWALVGGVLSGILGAGLAPIAEFFGGYITDIKLLELASLDRPLLRDLSLQAPGTWNHSMVIGQIAEAAADAIGAHGLLARVGAYYHDIGKTKKPAYFAENQLTENRHDKLTPSMSALIIKAHVKDGIELAKEHRLPQSIIDFIPQHHGTSLISYFYTKALRDAQKDEVIEERHYRYCGPKPQSKEAGILMLADQVEASSRTLTDPSPAKIQGLVQKIINRIFSSGELDECNLTLRDLHLIAKTFTRVLNGIYHRRVEYMEPAEKVKDLRAYVGQKEVAVKNISEIKRINEVESELKVEIISTPAVSTSTASNCMTSNSEAKRQGIYGSGNFDSQVPLSIVGEEGEEEANRRRSTDSLKRLGMQ